MIITREIIQDETPLGRLPTSTKGAFPHDELRGLRQIWTAIRIAMRTAVDIGYALYCLQDEEADDLQRTSQEPCVVIECHAVTRLRHSQPHAEWCYPVCWSERGLIR